MGIVHSRSTNLKLDLSYQQWELIGACVRTVTRGLRAKGYTTQAVETDRLGLNVDDILAAQRAEGHV